MIPWVHFLFDGGPVAEVAGHTTHSSRRRLQSDAQRHTALTLLGLRVVTFTRDDVVRRPQAPNIATGAISAACRPGMNNSTASGVRFPQMDASFWTDQLAAVVHGRKVILKVELLAQATLTVEMVRRLGAAGTFVFATTGIGTGPLPDAESFCMHTDVSGMSMNQAIHAGNRSVRRLTPGATEALDEFDPEHGALVIGDFLGDSPTLDGRPFLAHCRPEWLALDDKTVIDAFWDRAGVIRSPCSIIAANAEEVGEAFDRLTQGHGVVLAVDATHGWTGAGLGTRPVLKRTSISAAISG